MPKTRRSRIMFPLDDERYCKDLTSAGQGVIDGFRLHNLFSICDRLKISSTTIDHLVEMYKVTEGHYSAIHILQIFVEQSERDNPEAIIIHNYLKSTNQAHGIEERRLPS